MSDSDRRTERTDTRLIALRGRVVTDYEVWPGGVVLMEGSSVLEVGRDGELPAAADEVHDHGDSLILPGFVDLQVNGAFGVDAASEPGRVGELSERLLSTGTTAYLPTVISSPESLYEGSLPGLAAAANGGVSGAEILGIHLEGPFISVERRGAHAASHIIPPDPDMMSRLLDLGPVRMVTLAPEIEGSEELMRLARDRGAVVSAGHSDASFEVAYRALDGPVSALTHLFNAMSPLHHREPGLPGAAFAHPLAVCGLIADGLHVHPEVVGLAFRMLGPDRIYLVTDATAAAGMERGRFALATRTIYVEEGVPRLASGAIAGSVLTMQRAFQNILAFTGCTLPEAARMASTTPARLLGEGKRKGRLVPGYDADITILAPDLSVEAVWRCGRKVYGG